MDRLEHKPSTALEVNGAPAARLLAERFKPSRYSRPVCQLTVIQAGTRGGGGRPRQQAMRRLYARAGRYWLVRSVLALHRPSALADSFSGRYVIFVTGEDHLSSGTLVTSD